MLRLTLVAMIAIAAPAQAEWVAANPEVSKATTDPRIAEVLAAINRKDAAIVAGDMAGFADDFAPDLIVNSPFNTITTRAQAQQRFQSGVLTYKYLRRSIEYAARRRNDEVVLMGEETYEPPAGAPHAGKTVRRRFTDVWRKQRGRWLLSLRQATVFSVE